MNVCGRDYLIEHVFFAEEIVQKEKLYKFYVTDTLKYLNDTIADKLGGSVLKKRFEDVVEVKREKEKDPDDVICDIREKLNKMGEE